MLIVATPSGIVIKEEFPIYSGDGRFAEESLCRNSVADTQAATGAPVEPFQTDSDFLESLRSRLEYRLPLSPLELPQQRYDTVAS
jgi:hypothetical protein